jgi:hypothetical protein
VPNSDAEEGQARLGVKVKAKRLSSVTTFLLLHGYHPPVAPRFPCTVTVTAFTSLRRAQDRENHPRRKSNKRNLLQGQKAKPVTLRSQFRTVTCPGFDAVQRPACRLSSLCPLCDSVGKPLEISDASEENECGWRQA